MNFQESEAYLLSLGNEVAAMKLGLANITRLLAALGDPQRKYLKVQIAGTNGKGSVCAFLDSICRVAGIRAGVFTSPHLVSITERIMIGGLDISEDDFARHATAVRSKAEDMAVSGELEYTPTFFEQITAIALVAFAEAEAELAILETGLGGRLDATTAARAEIAVITRIDLDHQEYLGTSIEEIAAEKAAIINATTEVIIVGEQPPEAINPIIERSEAVGREVSFAELTESYREFGKLVLTDDSEFYVIETLGLAGRHQVENAWTAILVARSLRRYFSISKDDIESGLENARHPGRLEFDGQFLFDGAHNEGGAKALRAFLDGFVTQPITLIFGAMKGKDVSAMAKLLFPKADNLILTQPENERAMPVAELREFVSEERKAEMIFADDSVEAALKKSREMAGYSGIILVTGSLYLVGDVKRILKSQI